MIIIEGHQQHSSAAYGLIQFVLHKYKALAGSLSIFMLQICIFDPWTTLETQLGKLFVQIMWVTAAFTAQSSTRMYTLKTDSSKLWLFNPPRCRRESKKNMWKRSKSEQIPLQTSVSESNFSRINWRQTVRYNELHLIKYKYSIILFLQRESYSLPLNRDNFFSVKETS